MIDIVCLILSVCFHFCVLVKNRYHINFRFFSNETFARGGFNISYQESCGGNYMQNGKIVSPHFPNLAGNFECIYTISQNERSYNKLQFDHFDLGLFDDGCRSSYLEVRDGFNETSPLLGIFCGNMSDMNSSSLKSTKSKIWLK